MRRSLWHFLSLALPCFAAQPEPAKPATPTPTPATPAAGKPAAKAQTPAELLTALRTRYANAKTYQDEGTLVQKFTGPVTIESTLPFATSFERDGRFLWQFTSSIVPGGKPDSRFVVWTTDRKTYHSWWALRPETQDFDSQEMAMAGPTGVSGGSATAVVPLLTDAKRQALLLPEKPEDQGTEVLDGVECRKIAGSSLMGEVTVWIDAAAGAPAIRKIVATQVIDPSKLPPPPKDAGLANVGKFTVVTTVTFKPTFDAKVPDDAFDPKLPAPKQPAKPK